MKTLNSIKIAILCAMASATLVACGGAEGGGPTSPGQVLNNVTPDADTAVVAGGRVSIVSTATAGAASIVSQVWTVTQIGGETTTSPPVVADANCSGSVSTPGAASTGTSAGAAAKDGTATCATYITVPATAPTSDWAVQNVAKTATGSAGGQFVLKVTKAPEVGIGFGLGLSAAPILANTEQVVSLPANLTVNSGSTMQSVTYTWTQVSGPSVAIAGVATATASFVPHAAGDYVFKVKAVAVLNSGTQTREGTLVTVVGATSSTSTYVVNAGQIQRIALGTPVSLTGTVTGAASTAQMSYTWTQVSGPNATLYGVNTLTPQFLPAATGNYVFELQATQAGNPSIVRSSRALVTVFDSTSAAATFSVSAGDSQVLGNMPKLVTLNGSLSTTGIDAANVTLAWTQVSGPAATLTGPATLKPTFTATTAGAYVFLLTATAASGVQTAVTTVLMVAAALP